MKILLIEDEPGLREVISQSLEKELFLVEQAADFNTAFDKIALYDYSCILLDIMLPGGNGMELLQEIKRQKKADPVIIISAKDSLDDKVKGLMGGADDYLAKPFHIAELNARIRSVIRRRSFHNDSNRIEMAGLVIDLDQRSIHTGNREMLLNRKEFDILLYLIQNKNRLVNKTSLAEHVWGDRIDEADDFEFIYSQIKNLRKKLREHHADIEIQAVYGIGYKLITL